MLPTEAGEPRPGPHPDPPEDLHERELPLVNSRGPWFRLHRRGRDPIFFGKTGLGRFDAPDGSYGVLYAAEDFRGAFVETFGWITGVRVVSRSELEGRELAELASSEELALVDLTGKGLAHLGADARLATGDHTVSRRWSLGPDGLLYRARHDPEMLAVALHEKARTKGIDAKSLGTLSDPANVTLLAAAMDHYGFGL